MNSVLHDELRFFGERSHPAGPRRADPELEEVIALGLHLFGRLEALAARDQPSDAGSEDAARRWAPWFTRWHDGAAWVPDAIRETRRRGGAVKRSAEFLRAVMLAKIMGPEFEVTARSARDAAARRARPLEEVMGELQRHDDA